MKIAIHQPDFFPWLGFFHKAAMVDEFFFLDHVGAPRGRHWTNRNKILLNGQPAWLTLPIRKSGRSGQLYRDIEINYQGNFARKHLGTLRQAYAQARFFDEVYPWIEVLYAAGHRHLVDFNTCFIEEAMKKAGLDFKTCSTTSLMREHPRLKELSGNDLVLEICQCTDATGFLSGTGCLDFIKPESFEQEGISFTFQEFKHPGYYQGDSEFVPCLSALDALFHLGSRGMGDMLREMAEDDVP